MNNVLIPSLFMESIIPIMGYNLTPPLFSEIRSHIEFFNSEGEETEFSHLLPWELFPPLDNRPAKETLRMLVDICWSTAEVYARLYAHQPIVHSETMASIESRCRLIVLLRTLSAAGIGLKKDWLPELLENSQYMDSNMPLEGENAKKFYVKFVDGENLPTSGIYEILLSWQYRLMEFTKGELSHIIYPSKQDVPLRHIAHLGHGSFAIVDKVKDKHRLVYARKLFQFSPHQKQRIVPEVEREVQILKRLRYQPHMVHFICSYEAGNNLGILVQPAAEYNLHQYMELYPELDSMYSGEGMFSARRTVERFFGCLASALGFLHNQSIRHKDIKPQNILVHKHQIYLTDFGLALDFAQLDGSFTSGTGNAFTRRYAAPEVLLGERRDRKADIFSLGCVFLEIYTTLCHQCTPEDFFRDKFNSTAQGKDRAYAGILESIKNWLHLLPTTRDHDYPWEYENELITLISNMIERSPLSRPNAAEALRLVPNEDFFCNDCINKLGDNKRDNVSILIHWHYGLEQFLNLQPSMETRVMVPNNCSGITLKRRLKHAFPTGLRHDDFHILTSSYILLNSSSRRVENYAQGVHVLPIIRGDNGYTKEFTITRIEVVEEKLVERERMQFWAWEESKIMDLLIFASSDQFETPLSLSDVAIIRDQSFKDQTGVLPEFWTYAGTVRHVEDVVSPKPLPNLLVQDLLLGDKAAYFLSIRGSDIQYLMRLEATQLCELFDRRKRMSGNEFQATPVIDR